MDITRVTVVPADKLIIINGKALRFDYTLVAGHENMHALQYNGTTGEGHIEFENDYNQDINGMLYDAEIKPYVDAWQAEKDRLEAEAAAAEAARLAQYNSEEARFERLRAERDRRIENTDYLLMQDYPISEDDKAAVETYRQALRDLPAQEGAPWDGGEDETPWPTLGAPSITVAL